MAEAHILVVDDDKIVTRTLTILLKRLGYRTTTINNPIEAIRWLQLPGNFPDLIISDVTMPEMSGYEFVSHIRNAPITAHLPVIMLTANAEIDNKVDGFKAGADDYLIKPVDRTELEWRIKALLARAKKPVEAAARKEANVISVFSLRGGVGTSTIAVNLAIVLAKLWQKEIALLDLALNTGHAALMLNINPKYTLSDIVNWDTSTIEADTIERILLRHPSGVKLLAAPKQPSEAELITPTAIDRVWPYLRAKYPYLVIDAGSRFVEPNLTLLDRSQHIILPMAPEIGSVKAAVDAYDVFRQLGYDKQRVIPVLNHLFPTDGLAQQNIENTLKREIGGVIPYNRGFVRAINTGQPHVLAEPNSASSRALTTLAYQLSAGNMEADAGEHPSPLLAWVRKLVPIAA
jgi:pilus assembly protein CpaE